MPVQMWLRTCRPAGRRYTRPTSLTTPSDCFSITAPSVPRWDKHLIKYTTTHIASSVLSAVCTKPRAVFSKFKHHPPHPSACHFAWCHLSIRGTLSPMEVILLSSPMLALPSPQKKKPHNKMWIYCINTSQLPWKWPSGRNYAKNKNSLKYK